MKLVESRDNLLTFGIWGRNFLKDGQNVSSEFVGTDHAIRELVGLKLMLLLLALSVFEIL